MSYPALPTRSQIMPGSGPFCLCLCRAPLQLSHPLAGWRGRRTLVSPVLVCTCDALQRKHRVSAREAGPEQTASGGPARARPLPRKPGRSPAAQRQVVGCLVKTAGQALRPQGRTQLSTWPLKRPLLAVQLRRHRHGPPNKISMCEERLVQPTRGLRTAPGRLLEETNMRWVDVRFKKDGGKTSCIQIGKRLVLDPTEISVSSCTELVGDRGGERCHKLATRTCLRGWKDTAPAQLCPYWRRSGKPQCTCAKLANMKR